jgi:hypothetical protein
MHSLFPSFLRLRFCLPGCLCATFLRLRFCLQGCLFGHFPTSVLLFTVLSVCHFSLSALLFSLPSVCHFSSSVLEFSLLSVCHFSTSASPSSDATAKPKIVHQVFMQRASHFFSLGASFSRSLCVDKRKKGEYDDSKAEKLRMPITREFTRARTNKTG